MPRLHPIAERCLVFGLGVFVLATLAAWLADLSWPFELFAHFAPQLTVAAALLVVVSLVWRNPRAAFVAALLLVAHGLTWQRRVHPEAEGSECGATEMRIVTANLARRNPGHAEFLAWLAGHPADVVLIQELTPAWAEAVLPTQAEYPHRRLLARDDAYGIGVLSRWPLESVEVLDLAGDGLPSLAFVAVSGEARVQILDVHTLWPITPDFQRRRDRALAAAARWIRAQSLPAVLAGDLNLTPYAPAFARLLRESGLRDALARQAWRATWQAGFWPTALPIDHVLIPPSACVRAIEFGPDIGSDHRPVRVTLGWRGA